MVKYPDVLIMIESVVYNGNKLLSVVKYPDVLIMIESVVYNGNKLLSVVKYPDVLIMIESVVYNGNKLLSVVKYPDVLIMIESVVYYGNSKSVLAFIISFKYIKYNGGLTIEHRISTIKFDLLFSSHYVIT